jgi:hypothetical protein
MPSDASSKRDLQLLFEMLTSVGDGKCHAEFVSRVARSASHQHSHPALREVASIDPHNFERGLQSWARRQVWSSMLPDLYSFTITVDSLEGPVQREHYCLLPHEVFASLYLEARSFFEFLFVGPGDNLQRWWGEAERTSDYWFANHPVIREISDRTKIVPLGLHGDDAGVCGLQQVLVLTWGPVATKHATVDSRLVFSMLRVADIVKDGDVTMQEIYKVLAWSFRCLARGLWPASDHSGRPWPARSHRALQGEARASLAGDYRGAWAQLRGDWKFLRDCLHLEQHYGCNYICHLCRAHKNIARLRFTDFSLSAYHRRTMLYSERWWRQAMSATILCPLLLIPGFCIWKCMYDHMHTVHLGVHQEAVASTLWSLTDRRAKVWEGNTRQERCKSAWKAYKKWAKDNKVKNVVRRRFVMRAFKKPGKSPSMNQSTAKAATMPTLVRWLLEVCRQPGRCRITAAMYAAFHKAELLSRNAGLYFTFDEHFQYAAAVQDGLACYTTLSVRARASGQMLYAIKPKMHAWTHIAYDTHRNPTSYHCYQDEDMVGRCKRIYNRCHATTAPMRAVQRYSIMVCLRWWELEAQLRGVV